MCKDKNSSGNQIHIHTHTQIHTRVIFHFSDLAMGSAESPKKALSSKCSHGLPQPE